MKQLILIASISVICSLAAVHLFGPSAPAQGQRNGGLSAQAQGGHSGEQAAGAGQRMGNRGSEQASGAGQRLGNRGGEQAAGAGQRMGNRGGEQAAGAGQRMGNRGGEQAAGGGQRMGNRGGEQAASGEQRRGNRSEAQTDQHTHNAGGSGRGNQLAGFNPQALESSLAEMTNKLALDVQQQAAIRKLLTDYQQRVKSSREKTMQLRNRLNQLVVTSDTYNTDKSRLMEQAVTAYKDWIMLGTTTRESIYGVLNVTQQQILSGIEATQL